MSSELRTAVVDQVTYLNSLVIATTRSIIERSRRPVAIVVFSDHGLRHYETNRDETLRSLLLSYTPSEPGMFPSDASPINILPRLLNGYAGTQLPLASEESYWLAPRTAPEGFFLLEPWPAP